MISMIMEIHFGSMQSTAGLRRISTIMARVSTWHSNGCVSKLIYTRQIGVPYCN